MMDAMLSTTRRAGDAAAAATDWRADAPGTYCRRCGATCHEAALTASGCPYCRGERVAWQGVWRLGAYEEPLSRWIVELKFHGQWTWATWFGRELARITADVPADLAEGSAVVPIALHWRRRIGRGFDQTMLVARAFAQASGRDFAPLLTRRRATTPQSHIHEHAARLRNIQGAFVMPDVDLAGRTIWLVDDVKTTGATARVASHLLRRAGAKRVHLVVLAVADPGKGRA